MWFVELLKAVVWPVMLAGLVLYFRDEIRRLTTRLVEIGPSGLKLSQTAQQTTPLEPTPVPAPGSAVTPGSAVGAGEFAAVVRAQFAPEEIDWAMQLLQSDLTARAGNDPKDQVEFLRWALAGTTIQWRHERNYNMIYGSQLELLARLNGGPIPLAACRPIYDTAVSKHPDFYRTYSFEQWIGFLRNSGLVQISPNADCDLTPSGRGLLRYIVVQKLATVKLL
jgi:hypothetical protein